MTWVRVKSEKLDGHRLDKYLWAAQVGPNIVLMYIETVGHLAMTTVPFPSPEAALEWMEQNRAK